MKNKTVLFTLVLTIIGYSQIWSNEVKVDPAQVDAGKKVFMTTCFACHGADGKGMVPGTPNLLGEKSPLLQESSILKERILKGYQSKGSPLAMPPKGGNPALTEKEIDDVIVFMKAAFIKKS